MSHIHLTSKFRQNKNSAVFLAKNKFCDDQPANAMTNFMIVESCNSMIPNQHIPVDTSSSSKLLHSWRNRLAPVKLPSPPMHTRFVMPLSNKFNAARRRPSRSRKSLQRALPITVPPYKYTPIVNYFLFLSKCSKCHSFLRVTVHYAVSFFGISELVFMT